MSDDPDWLAKLKEKRQYLVEWLKGFEKSQDAAENAKRILDYTEWQISVVESRPAQADEVPFPNLSNTLDSDLAQLPDTFPMPPLFDHDAMLSASAFTSSGTQDVSMYAGRVGDLGTEETDHYATIQFDRLDELHNIYDRSQELTDLIGLLGNQGTMKRLERAISSYRAYQTSTGTRSSAAADMRTLLDGIKGDLFELASEHEGENMTWDRMARRLAKGSESGPEYDQLLRLEESRSSLYSRLSDVVKDREAGSLTDLDQLWIQLQDHLISVIGLLDLPIHSRD